MVGVEGPSGHSPHGHFQFQLPQFTLTGAEGLSFIKHTWPGQNQWSGFIQIIFGWVLCQQPHRFGLLLSGLQWHCKEAGHGRLGTHELEAVDAHGEFPEKFLARKIPGWCGGTSITFAWATETPESSSALRASKINENPRKIIETSRHIKTYQDTSGYIKTLCRHIKTFNGMIHGITEMIHGMIHWIIEYYWWDY